LKDFFTVVKSIFIQLVIEKKWASCDCLLGGNNLKWPRIPFFSMDEITLHEWIPAGDDQDAFFFFLVLVMSFSFRRRSHARIGLLAGPAWNCGEELGRTVDAE
jgi:hypothetical protein